MTSRLVNTGKISIHMYECDDCKDTKQIITEGIKLGKPLYSKIHKKIITPYETDGDFKLTQCHCVGD